MSDIPPFELLLESLRALGGGATADPALREQFRSRAQQLAGIEPTRTALAAAIQSDPALVPILGLVVGLSQEGLKGTLRVRLGSAGWIRLARQRPDSLVGLLDDEFGLVARLSEELTETWGYGDILLERAGPRTRAGRAIGRGRALEDEVERVVGRPDGLDLPYELRTQFAGSAGRHAPCDVAIPRGGNETQIAVAVKGFDATGSKLTDASREVEAMAEVRLPRQYIFAVVDGIGWHGRKSDLRRIYDLWVNRSIDGLYTLNQLGAFRADVRRAAQRLGLTTNKDV